MVRARIAIADVTKVIPEMEEGAVVEETAAAVEIAVGECIFPKCHAAKQSRAFGSAS